MSLITPNSQIKLYSDVEITDGLEMVFKSKAGQDAYFKSKLRASNVTCTYIKKTGKCRIEFPTSTVSQCNFITFTNASFENVTFYARVTNWEYVNNVTSDIMYEIDWFQTYMFNVEYKDAKIEREHLSEDDFQALEKNPWKTGIYEMETEEGLAVDKNMLNFPVVGTEDDDTMYSIEVGDLYAVMQLSPYETDDTSLDELLTENSSGFYSPKDNLIHVGDKGESPAPAAIQYMKFPNPNYIAFFQMSKTDNSGQIGLANVVKTLTINNASHNIIALYSIPRGYIHSFVTANSPTPDYANFKVKTPAFSKYVNKKLYRAPYQFIELHLANEVKEYQYENFVLNATGENAETEVEFDVVASLENIPMLAILPAYYKYAPGDGLMSQLNVDERIEYKNIPHISYNIDDYSSFLGSQYQSALTTSDNEIYANEISSSAALGDNILRNDIGAIQAQGPAVSAAYLFRDMLTQLKNGLDYFSGGTDYINKYAQNQTQLDLLNEANSVKKGDFVSNVYGQAKRVLGGSRYVAGNTGTLELYAGVAGNVGAPVVCKREVKPAILEQYDNFFSNYGYTSNRVGVPRVCHYIKATDTQPHFQDGFTYVKTSGMQVISNVKPASDYIESMFDRGCKFKKGD